MQTPLHTRRETLKHSLAVAGLLASAGLMPSAAHAAYSKALFEAKTPAEVYKALGASAPVESKDVILTAPDIAENGAVVPLGVSTTLAGVKTLLILVEKNPNTAVALFHVSDAVEANFSTRAKLGQSSDVLAVAQMADGRWLFSKKEVKVTLGGCGG
jgi:sulfur-oxidizing protein SoxY